MKIGASLVTLLVLIHHGIAYVHGGAHEQLQIPMATWQDLFINLVILIVPLIGVVLVWTKWSRWGLFAIMWAMVGALIFGVAHHYALTSPDHISHLPTGDAHVHASFIWTASGIAILEGLAAVAAAYFAAAQRILRPVNA